MTISYNASKNCRTIGEFLDFTSKLNGQSQTAQADRQDEVHKMEEREISWDEVTESSKFVRLVEDERSILVIKDWKVVETKNRFKKKDEDPETVMEFRATVLEENGNVVEKTLNSTSKPLLLKLKPILKEENKDVELKISIKPIGKSFDRVYDVEKVE